MLSAHACRPPQPLPLPSRPQQSLSSCHALAPAYTAAAWGLQAVAIMNQLALELDINMAVDNVRAILLELLNCERVTLFLVDLQQKELR